MNINSLFAATKIETLPPIGDRGFKQCLICNKEFTNQNVYSKMGWRETQISGFCELCFDEVCKDYEE